MQGQYPPVCNQSFFVCDRCVWLDIRSSPWSYCTGYIQTELMTCCLSRKHKNLVLFLENIQFLCLCFGGLWHNKHIWKIVFPLYFLKYGNLNNIYILKEQNVKKFLKWRLLTQFELNIFQKVLNLNLFCQDNKSWVPFYYNPYSVKLAIIGFFTIRKSDAYLSDYLTDLKFHRTK